MRIYAKGTDIKKVVKESHFKKLEKAGYRQIDTRELYKVIGKPIPKKKVVEDVEDDDQESE